MQKNAFLVIERVEASKCFTYLLAYFLFGLFPTAMLTRVTYSEELPKETPLFKENFETGISNWELMDPDTWNLKKSDGSTTFEIVSRESAYQPKVRSPLHMAIVKEVEVDDFSLTFRVRSTKDTGAHRDCCVFFGYQDPTHFYYVHLGAKPDPASGQIMIVNDAPRRPLTTNEKLIPWDDQWHAVKLERAAKSGGIAIYFDDMDRPIMEANDTTFGRGRFGIGSFDDMNEFDDIELFAK